MPGSHHAHHAEAGHEQDRQVLGSVGALAGADHNREEQIQQGGNGQERHREYRHAQRAHGFVARLGQVGAEHAAHRHHGDAGRRRQGYRRCHAASRVSSANASARPARCTSRSRVCVIVPEQPLHDALGVGGHHFQPAVLDGGRHHARPAQHFFDRHRRRAPHTLAVHHRSHLVHAALRDQLALGQHGHAMRQRLGLFQVVRGQDHRRALRHHLPQRGPQHVARRRIQAHGGLVEEQQRGPAADGQRELRQPLLPARELLVLPVRDRRRARQRQHLVHGVGRRVVAGRSARSARAPSVRAPAPLPASSRQSGSAPRCDRAADRTASPCRRSAPAGRAAGRWRWICRRRSGPARPGSRQAAPPATRRRAP